MGNVTMEVLSQLLELIKNQGILVVLVAGAAVFGYFKLWPLYVKRSEEAIAAREAMNHSFLEAQERSNLRFTESLATITKEHSQALERRDQVQAQSAAANAAAVDRNTVQLGEVARQMSDLARRAN